MMPDRPRLRFLTALAWRVIGPVMQMPIGSASLMLNSSGAKVGELTIPADVGIELSFRWEFIR